MNEQTTLYDALYKGLSRKQINAVTNLLGRGCAPAMRTHLRKNLAKGRIKPHPLMKRVVFDNGCKYTPIQDYMGEIRELRLHIIN